jgi:hypothetical protein
VWTLRTALPEGSAIFLKLSSQAMAAAVEHLYSGKGRRLKNIFGTDLKKKFWSKYNLAPLILNRSTKQGWFRYLFTIFTMDKFAHRDDTTETGDSAPTDLNIPVFDRQKLPVKLEAFKK